MSNSSDTAPPAPPFRLETFGTLVLREPDGSTLVADHGQQERRLALLAVLAASGERGVSRDRLLLLFWPETSQQRARHALEQTLYKARKSLNESLFAGVNPLRLNPAVVTSDVGDFEQALGGGDLEAAVGHYRGPLLDGFYLSDAPEFDQWLSGERARLEGEYTGALEGLAKAAEDAGDHETATRWRQKLCETDALSSRYAIGLIRALAKAGDHASALRHAEQYARLVEQELGTSAGPEIAALTADIRARARVEPAADPQVAPEGFPPARVPGHPVEATPDVVTAPAGDRTASRRMGRAASYAIVALAVAITAFAATRLWYSSGDGSAAVASEPSIAVLPLTNLSTDPADAALADGMTQELIAMLGRARDLRVIASTSVFALEDPGMDVRRIADSLRVSHVLEGGFQKVGSRLRVQVRLVDAGDGSTRWSETYDREMGDIFAVQEEISFAVARELDVRLAGVPGSTSRRHDPDIMAYEWYLRGITANLLGGGASGRRQGIEYLHRAIVADSNFAGAYAMLTWMYLNEAGTAPGDYQEWTDRAEQAASRAVTLDDSLPIARSALGWSRMADDDYAAAEAELKQAIALDPAVHRGYEGLARVYMITGRPADQLTMAQRGMEIDPLSVQAIRELALAYNMNDRCDETLELLRPLKSLDPRVGVAGVIRGLCYAKEEMWPEAIAEFRWATEETPARAALAFLGYSLARAERREEAMSILSDLLAERKYSHGAFGIAVVYAGLRDYDQAFDWLDRAVDEGSVRVYLLDPVFADLHRDPRFARLKERMGIQNR